MAEIAKCPLCGKGEMTSDGADIRMCSKCWFRCDVSDLPRVSTAMELAKLAVQMKTCRAYCPEMAFLHAQDRVLEVFSK